MLLAWPLAGLAWLALAWLDRLRVVLAAVAVWTAPAAAVAVAGASIKRARLARPCGRRVALRWWRGQVVNELARLALLALPLVWWPWRESNPRRRCGALQWSRPWPLRAVVLVLYIGVVLLEGNKASGVTLSQLGKRCGVNWRALGGYLAPVFGGLELHIERGHD